MRITDRSLVENAIKYMNDSKERLSQLQETNSTGKVYQNISDDPTRASQVLSLQSSLTTNQAYLDTGHAMDSWMTANDDALKQMTDAVTRAKQLANQGVSTTISADQRTALANEVNTILQQAVDIGNSSYAGKYLFSGFQTKTESFSIDSQTGVVTYHGDAGTIKQDVSPGQTMTTNFAGDSTFSKVFSALLDTRDALLANNAAKIQEATGKLSDSLEPVTTAITTNGARQRELDVTLSQMDNTQLDLKGLISQKQDANMAEAVSMLNYQQTVYQTVLDVSSRAISALNLFEMLK